MIRFLKSILFCSLFILLGAASCNKKAVPVKSAASSVEFEDDLSKYRPEYETIKDQGSTEAREVIKNSPITSDFDISEKLNVVLDSITIKNRRLGYRSGYTILVYSGTSRIEADRIRNQLYDIAVGEEVPPLQYELPTYFVKIGQFHEQIEGQPLYLKIRSFYPDAAIVPEKFKVKDEL